VGRILTGQRFDSFKRQKDKTKQGWREETLNHSLPVLLVLFSYPCSIAAKNHLSVTGTLQLSVFLEKLSTSSR
jgi:hypothetical protein